jgi:ABC-type lipoprotein release transport system permease subunit
MVQSNWSSTRIALIAAIASMIFIGSVSAGERDALQSSFEADLGHAEIAQQTTDAEDGASTKKKKRKKKKRITQDSHGGSFRM